MKQREYDLSNKNYNLENIKYQILYYFEFVEDIVLKDNIMIIFSHVEYDDTIIYKIIEDNEVKLDVKVQPLKIEYQYLKQEEIEYIENEVSLFYEYLSKHDKRMMEKGSIVSSQGINITTAERLEYKKLVDSVFNRILVRLFDAKEYEVPSIIDIKLIQKCNYLHGSFHHVNYVSKMQHKYDIINKFKKKNITYEVSKEYLTDSQQVLNPAICLHCYPLLKNQNIEDKNYVYTISGKAYRDESGNLNNSIRLKEFQIREFVCIGNKEHVELTFIKVIEMLKVIGEALKLDYKLVPATDIFFDDDISKKTLFQKVMKNKIEFEVFDHVLNKSCAIGSVNAHGTHFSDAYQIYSGEELSTSMCLGFGIERVVQILIDHYYRKESLAP